MDSTVERRMAIRASNYAALDPLERKKRVWAHAWHCVCIAAARRMVRTGDYGKEPTLAVVVEDDFALQQEEAAT